MEGYDLAKIFLLNEDCLHAIFDWLPDLRNQVSLARTCRPLCNIMVGRWRKSHLYQELDFEMLRVLLPEYDDFKFFLHAMRDHFKWLHIANGCLSAFLNDIKHMNISCFPQVITFNYDPDNIDCYVTNNNMLALTKLLPNLEKLRFTQPIDGRFIVCFQQLKELYLYDDQAKEFEIDQRNLEEICMGLKNLSVLDIRHYDGSSKLRLDTCINNLKNLVDLKLNLAVLKPILPDVLRLERLRKLSVLLDYDIDPTVIASVDNFDYKIYETREFFQILNAKVNSIIGLAIDNYYMALIDDWDKGLSFHERNKLQKLAICSWTVGPEHIERFLTMTNLTLLCLRNCDNLDDEIVLKFIDRCVWLEHLDVSYCKKLTEKLPLRMLTMLKERGQKQILYVYYLMCGFEDEIDTKCDVFCKYAAYIRFSKDFPPGCERGLSYIERGYEFEFE